MGLFDFDLTPQQLGLLGAANAVGQAYTPQPASRLPLARPNAAFLLGQAAGGLGQGYAAGQQVQAQQLANQRALVQSQALQQLMQRMSSSNPLGTPGATGSGLTFGNAPSVQAPGVFGSAPPATAAPSSGVAGGGATNPSQSGVKPMRPLSDVWNDAQLASLGGMPQIGQEMLAYVRQALIPGSTLMGDGSVGLAPGVPKALQQKYMADNGYEWNDSTASFVPAKGLLQGKYDISRAEAQGKVGPALEEARGKGNIDVGVNRQKLTDEQVAQYGRQPTFGPTTYFGASGGGASGPSPAFAPPPPSPMPSMGAMQSTTQPPTPAPVQAAAAPYTQPGDTVTSKGTVIPARPMDEIPAGSKNYDQVIDENKKIVPDWDEKRQLLDVTGNRLEIMANLLKNTTSGAFSENRAEWANKINALADQTGWGFLKSLAKTVASETDMNAIKRVEYQAYQEVLNQLKTINQGAGGRILKVEVETGMEKGISADQPAGALYGDITDTLGQVWRARNLIDDFHHSGWINAGKFANEWQSNPVNSIDNHQEVARNYLGPFKGMEGAPNAPALTKTINGKTYRWVP